VLRSQPRLNHFPSAQERTMNGSKPWLLLGWGAVMAIAYVGHGLHVGRTKVSDSGMTHLVALPGLTTVSLDGTRVTDAGLEDLSKRATIKWLKLNNTEISDVGLGHLARLSNLEVLFVKETRVTSPGIAELQKHLPNCKIYHDTVPNE